MSGYTDLLGPRRVGPTIQHASTSTSQRKVLTGRADEMKFNAAGGAVFTLNDWDVVRRFLILGTTQNTYYASAERLSQDAKIVLDRALAADPIKFVDTIVEVSLSGAPLKQSSCLFALSLACSRTTGDAARDTNNSDPVTVGRVYALSKAPLVLRTFQHTFEFMDYATRQRGGGAGLKRLISRLVSEPSARDVEYQALKYRQRVGWTPRDLLRYGHPQPTDAERDHLFSWIVRPESEKGRLAVAASARLAAYEELQATTDVATAVRLISEQSMTHEFVPNTLLAHREIWEALLPNLPLTALVRNLRKMTQVGLLVDGSAAVKLVNAKLTNVEALRKARLHPLRIMGAIGVYESGDGGRHGEAFKPSSRVLQSLEDALELAFSVIEPLNKRVGVAIDCSGSMSQASPMAGLTAFHACLALAAWYRRSEEDCTLLLFDQSARPLNVRKNVSWSELRKTSNPSGSTNLAAPVSWLINKRQDVDVLITMTDNETWSGNSHYVEQVHALQKKASHPIATSVVAVTATDCTVSDPKDPHALDVAGFDATVAEAIGAHVREVFKN